MNSIVFSLFDGNHFAQQINQQLGYDLGSLTLHQFPDEETLVTITSDVKNKEVILIADLLHPNAKILPLLFTVETIRELNPKRIVLVAPYLPYMRQDKSFQQGQGITSKYFAKLLSRYVDLLITVDPHIHRWKALSEIYSIPTINLHAGKKIYEWISSHVADPLIVGPDSESEQWVSEIAKSSNLPSVILEKSRTGDRDVEVVLPNIKAYQHCTPILIDDIISTGVTVLKTFEKLAQAGLKAPICIAIHGVFAANAYDEILKAGAKLVVTCNTLAHVSNQIDLSTLICEALKSINT